MGKILDMKSKHIWIFIGLLVIGIMLQFTVGENVRKDRSQNKSSKNETELVAEQTEEIVYEEEFEEVETPRSLPEVKQPKDPWKNATGISYWYVWYSKGDGSTYSTQMEQPNQHFSSSLFKEENGKDCFVRGFKRVHRKTLTQDDTPTGKESQWFVCVDSKESSYNFNTWVIMPHEHFSIARAKAEFEEKVFILNFERIY